MTIEKRLLFLLSFLFAIFLIIAVFAVGIYKFSWTSRPTRQFATIVPLPAAVVNGQVTTYRRVFSMLDAYQNLTGLESGLTNLSEVQAPIIDALIDDELVSQIARAEGISLKKDEVLQYYQELLEKFQLQNAQMNAKLRQSLGMQEKYYIKKVVEPELLKIKLRDHLQSRGLSFEQILAAKRQASRIYIFGKL